MTPISARSERTSMATAGVGSDQAGTRPCRRHTGRHHRVLDHVAGQSRVLAKHDAVAMAAALERQAGGHADPQSRFSAVIDGRVRRVT